MEQVQLKAAKMMKGLELLAHEERQRALPVQLWSREGLGEHAHVCKHLMEEGRRWRQAPLGSIQ